MGSEAYTWITKYKEDLAEALECARQETFAAGKFLGAEENPATIEEAMEYDPEGGTGSLLEIGNVSETPELLCACWLPKEKLLEFLGTEHPSLEEIKQCLPFWESFDRGGARAIVLYENGKKAKICFAAWTIDNLAVGDGSFEDVPPAGARKSKKKKATPKAKPTEEEKKADLALFEQFVNDLFLSEQATSQGVRELQQYMMTLFKKYSYDAGFMNDISALQQNAAAKAVQKARSKGK